MRLQRALAGSEIAVRTPGSRRPQGRPASELDGNILLSVESRGKHLLLRFSQGLVLHSHLGMRGSWQLFRHGEGWRRPRTSAWISLSDGTTEAVNFNGSSLRIIPEQQLRRDPRLARLGPDILGPELSAARGAVALRRGASGISLGEALLDQTLLAGIGNIFKSEGCWAAELDPWRRVDHLSDDELPSLVAVTRELMETATRTGRRPGRVYRRAGRPCPRCGATIRSKPQGDDARLTYWCPRCQR